MPGEFMERAVLNSIIASLIFLGGAFCLSEGPFAQETGQAQQPAVKKTSSVQVDVRDGYRYISGFGVPHHAKDQARALGIVSTPYAFRVPVKPTKMPRVTPWAPGMIFGVALDGVPIKTAVDGYWNDNQNWLKLKRKFDAYGGFIEGQGAYMYGAIPSGLISKDLSHVGYAADGFPIFVSKNNKFTSSYRLLEGRRSDPPNGPGGVYDGAYFRDYNYISGAGVLDNCNGVNIKGKYYIYILTPDFLHIPKCWRGVPDPTFFSASSKAGSNLIVNEGDNEETRQMKNRQRR